ncbi:hypothetical protein PUNSTDRAFT_52681 [Punctularia strigosozonata HHB-11173 SS5]|uniref:uncharacterized protein n=1 Tax=Punctularia strigosozonata (strain HHB-11173) TaxID=741275 RepID=UPI0004416FC0|nr:uncharacterized protein PUNSTDRAFT_52681 [Punctularia strigosozonata HHB-11173 SS5]EIN08226.1 hypothetical protein PUNSTDRAFT_52681 [Punctularia strigosozonata HHB-11173 SS5]
MQLIRHCTRRDHGDARSANVCRSHRLRRVPAYEMKTSLPIGFLVAVSIPSIEVHSTSGRCLEKSKRSYNM